MTITKESIETIETKLNNWVKNLDSGIRKCLKDAECTGVYLWDNYNFIKYGIRDFNKLVTSAKELDKNYAAKAPARKDPENVKLLKYAKFKEIDADNFLKKYTEFSDSISLEEEKVIEYINLVNKHGKEKANLEQQLMSDSKPLSELSHSVDFDVIKTYQDSFSTYVYESNGIVGPGHHSSKKVSGHGYKTILEVSSKDNDISKLIFEGNDGGVRGGDKITALLPVYEKQRTPISCDEVYLPREFKPEEQAIELTILNEKGEPCKQVKSIDYENYMPEPAKEDWSKFSRDD